MSYRYLRLLLLLTIIFGVVRDSRADKQQAPKTLPGIILLNDSDTKITIECRTMGVWETVSLAAHADGVSLADMLRIQTTRGDGATITVEFPIKLGRKYIVFWNDAAGMWDLKGAH